MVHNSLFAFSLALALALASLCTSHEIGSLMDNFARLFHAQQTQQQHNWAISQDDSLRKLPLTYINHYLCRLAKPWDNVTEDFDKAIQWHSDYKSKNSRSQWRRSIRDQLFVLIKPEQVRRRSGASSASFCGQDTSLMLGQLLTDVEQHLSEDLINKCQPVWLMSESLIGQHFDHCPKLYLDRFNSQYEQIKRPHQVKLISDTLKELLSTDNNKQLAHRRRGPSSGIELVVNTYRMGIDELIEIVARGFKRAHLDQYGGLAKLNLEGAFRLLNLHIVQPCLYFNTKLADVFTSANLYLAVGLSHFDATELAGSISQMKSPDSANIAHFYGNWTLHLACDKLINEDYSKLGIEVMNLVKSNG